MYCMTNTEIAFALECYAVIDLAEPAVSSATTTAPLTARELEIVQLLAEGKANKQVAVELGISVRTVETHRRHIMQKLRIRSLVELLFYAIQHGIVPGSRDRQTSVPAFETTCQVKS